MYASLRNTTQHYANVRHACLHVRNSSTQRKLRQSDEAVGLKDYKGIVLLDPTCAPVFCQAYVIVCNPTPIIINIPNCTHKYAVLMHRVCNHTLLYATLRKTYTGTTPKHHSCHEYAA